MQIQIDFESRLPVAAQIGMQQAYDNADPRWKREVEAAIRQVALTHEMFTADEVVEELNRNDRHFVTHNNSAMGNLMKEVSRTMKYMRFTEQVKRSRRGKAKGHYLRVWESLLFKTGDDLRQKAVVLGS